MGGEGQASGAPGAAPEVLFTAPWGPGRHIPAAAGGRRHVLEGAPRRSARLNGDPSPAHLGAYDCG
jgi:acyl dehydratase